MGKRKIGEIYNKPIVEGDKNLVTKNEIHKNELSGGNTPSGGGGGNIEYLDTSNADQDMIKEALIGMGLYAHIRLNASMNFTAHIPCAMVMQLATIENSFDKVLAVAIDFSARIRQFGGDFMTVKDFLLQNGVSEEALASIPRITEEEFYNIN